MPEYLTCSQLADYLQVSVNVVRGLTRVRSNTNIPFIAVGRALRFHRASIDQWLLSRQNGR
jgi:excisionase family DNA binding protein